MLIYHTHLKDKTRNNYYFDIYLELPALSGSYFFNENLFFQ